MNTITFVADYDPSTYACWLEGKSLAGDTILEAKVRDAAEHLKATIALLPADVITMLGTTIDHCGKKYAMELYRCAPDQQLSAVQ